MQTETRKKYHYMPIKITKKSYHEEVSVTERSVYIGTTSSENT